MRFHATARSLAIFTAAFLAGAAVIGVSGKAAAGNRLHDQVYADSFGNLIVHSPYGYKRIIVGEGSLAKQLQNYTRGGEPAVVYADPQPHYDRHGYYFDNCYRPPVLLKGRSYMYGLPDGVIPEPSGHCPPR
jgi:hypothetical protein